MLLYPKRGLSHTSSTLNTLMNMFNLNQITCMFNHYTMILILILCGNNFYIAYSVASITAYCLDLKVTHMSNENIIFNAICDEIFSLKKLLIVLICVAFEFRLKMPNFYVYCFSCIACIVFIHDKCDYLLASAECHTYCFSMSQLQLYLNYFKYINF